jgi:hypothetical protein
MKHADMLLALTGKGREKTDTHLAMLLGSGPGRRRLRDAMLVVFSDDKSATATRAHVYG